MIIDGVAIAEKKYADIKTQIRERNLRPVLGIVVCNPNFETKKYLVLKERKAAEVGIGIEIETLSEDATTKDFITSIESLAQKTDGVILQLPVPASIDLPAVISAIPPHKDVDALNPETTKVLSPVVRAIKEILNHHQQSVAGKEVVVVGQGRLVGAPAAKWFAAEGAQVTSLTKDDGDISTHVKTADILVLGAGVAGLVVPAMIQDGVIIMDAGTSEDGGELRGDASPLCAEKASLFTPVPGGIGPITVAMLLQNVVDCAGQKKDVI